MGSLARPNEGPRAPSRRTQHERSGLTTALILSATIDLLHDRGFYRTSTSDIAEHAGVSRGALSHHFASKEDIVVAAIARQLRGATAGLHAMAADIRRLGRTTDDIVEHLWRIMSDRLFYVTMEYLPEARHNVDFHAKIVPVVQDFHAGLDAVWAELARQADVDVAHARTLMNATMCLIRGMIAQTAVKDDPAYFRALLEFWKGQVRREFGPRGAHAPSPRQAAGNLPAGA